MSYKKALITGASRGLGKEMACVLANNDYDLILHSKETKLPEILRSFRFDRKCDKVYYTPVYGDIRCLDTISELTALLKREEANVLINNAGIYLNKQISDTSFEECWEILGANLISSIILIKSVFQAFKEKGCGTIININSLAGKFGSDGESIYSASKHGLGGFLKSLQFEATKHNIQIVDVYLGAMKTDMTKERKDLEKLMKPYEVAKCIYSACLSDDVMACGTTRITELHINRRIY